MAYIIQHRRDTLENWEKVNPVLADAEIGFVLAPGTSMYKIGNGATAWNDLPLFGFGGNFYDNFDGDDLDQSVPSRRAVLEKLQEIAQEIIQGSENVEGLLDKLSVKQLVQLITPEDFEGISPDDENSPLKNQIASRWVVLKEFQHVWDNLTSLEESHIKLSEDFVKALKDFADQYGPIEGEIKSIKTTLEGHDGLLKEHATKLIEHADALDRHTNLLDGHTSILEKHTYDIDANTKCIHGYNEEVEKTDPETGESIIETIYHKGINDLLGDVSTSISEVDEKVDSLTNDINTKLQILSEEQYADIKDFSSYPEGTLFFTYKNQ